MSQDIILNCCCCCVVANAACLTMPERGPQNSSWHGARSTPVVDLGLEHHTGMELKGNYHSPVPCTRDSAHKTFEPTDLMSTYSLCTRGLFGGIGHRIHAFRSEVRCSNH
ncbi:hypothetical protein TNCV_1544561 [Trichonephila clavipes]|nr:hypothetical protein TNCV_1544561 [Trichonephila clavipes]